MCIRDRVYAGTERRGQATETPAQCQRQGKKLCKEKAGCGAETVSYTHLDVYKRQHPKAQLAYSFDIAMQNELTLEENMELARKFVQEQFVAKGMIADLAFQDVYKRQVL